MQGRKPLPAPLKILRGGTAKKNELTAEHLREVPDPPARLWPEQAKGCWLELAPMLVGAGSLTNLDLPVFENYCAEIGLARLMAEEIAKTGPLYLLPNGCRAENPAVAIRHRAIQNANRMARELGLTATDRPRLTKRLPPAATVDPAAEFFG